MLDLRRISGRWICVTVSQPAAPSASRRPMAGTTMSAIWA